MNLIPIKTVCDLTGASRHFIERSFAAGRFPPPIKLGERKRMWISAEVTDWLDERAAARRCNRISGL